MYRKTYEAEMFHRASLKLGLERAVLQGVTKGAGGSAADGSLHGLDKDELAKVLKHG